MLQAIHFRLSPISCIHLATISKVELNIGNAQKVQESYVYSSAYDKDEGYTSGDIAVGGKLTVNHPNLPLYTAGPDPTFSIKCGRKCSEPKIIQGDGQWNTGSSTNHGLL